VNSPPGYPTALPPSSRPASQLLSSVCHF
jgi:hypothetical protein